MKTRLILQSILIFGGLIIIGLSINFLAAVGVLLVMWGNNIQMADNYTEHLIKTLNKLESKENE